ncbi:hypothetical protein KUU80_06875 [Pseudomonas aeruginosa]|uniref:hypothetical protein n=1 Tax=Pseudomonas aeruginosa TaxID=287 RepID=UPI001C9DE144|nr:hypothetical protein [Pseudomonas aeruginosa]QZW02938.1 hypothetical protein KUU80_06875 [Pseudomonas aeruginosa]
MRDQQTTTNPPEACAQNPDWRQDLSYALIESLMAEPEEQAKAFLKAHLERLPYYERFGLSHENLVLLMEDLFKQLQYTFSFLGIDATWLRQRQLERQVAQTNAYSVLKALQSAVTQLRTHEGPSPVLWFWGSAGRPGRSFGPLHWSTPYARRSPTKAGQPRKSRTPGQAQACNPTYRPLACAGRRSPSRLTSPAKPWTCRPSVQPSWPLMTNSSLS